MEGSLNAAQALSATTTGSIAGSAMTGALRAMAETTSVVRIMNDAVWGSDLDLSRAAGLLEENMDLARMREGMAKLDMTFPQLLCRSPCTCGIEI